MISSVGAFSATSYLDQVKGVVPVTPVNKQPQQTDPDQDAASAGPLQTGNGLAISSDVLTLLQDSDNQSSGLAALLKTQGDDTTSQLLNLLREDTTTGAFDGSLASVVDINPKATKAANPLFEAASSAQSIKQSVNQGLQNAADTIASQDTLQSALSSYRQGINAYNKVLQDTTDNLLKESQSALDSLVA